MHVGQQARYCRVQDLNVMPPAIARIPGLDGLRAVSILLVMYSHVIQTYHWSKDVPFMWRLTPGATGVSVFFVISGYLITTLLLREQAQHGRIGLRGFYMRRFFRIVPAYLAYVAAVALLGHWGWVKVTGADFAKALLYVTNYTQVNWVFIHTWSLSVEEQFYLLLPLLMLFCNRLTLTRVLVSALAVSVVARLGNQVYGVWPFNAEYAFEGRVDQLAFGCLCALVQQQAPANQRQALARMALPLGAGLLIVAIALPVGGARTGFFNTLIGLATALLIHACSSQPGLWITRLLENPALRGLGLISYSLYLWQQIWLAPELKFSLPVALGGSLVCGVVSYYLIEKTGLRLRRELERRQANRPAQAAQNQPR